MHLNAKQFLKTIRHGFSVKSNNFDTKLPETAEKDQETERALILFKVHYWNDDILRQFDRLKGICNDDVNKKEKNIDIAIFVDSSNGPVDIPDGISDKIIISSASDVELIGMSAETDHNIFWYSNEIPAIVSAIRNIDYNTFVMMEYDVVIKIKMKNILEHMTKNHLDFLSYDYNYINNAGWAWNETCTPYYDQDSYKKCLNCFAAFSRKALMVLLERRLYYSNLIRKGELPFFPNSEAFVATEIDNAGLSTGYINEIWSADCYRWSPSYLESDIHSLNSDFIHPVSGRSKFIQTTFFEPKHRYLEPGSEMRSRCLVFPDDMLPDVYNTLRAEKFSAEHLDVVMEDIRNYASPEKKAQFGIDRENLAKGSRAVQSSMSEWSLSEKDAEDFVNHIPNGGQTFHTDAEQDPWIMVELNREADIETIVIYNRQFLPSRANGLIVLGSTNGTDWISLAQHTSEIPFGGIADNMPFVVHASKRLRYVKLQLSGHRYLTLDHMAVYGKFVEAPHDA